MLTISLADLFPRTVEVGGSQGFCGALDIVAIVRPFTAGEEAVLTWCAAQDGATVSELASLPDGRDIIVLRRLHTRQTIHDAIRETEEHLAKTLAPRVVIAT